MKNKKNRNIFMALLLVGGIAAAVFIFLQFSDSGATSNILRTLPEGDSGSAGEAPSGAGKAEIVYQGNTYVYNQDIRNILFLGVDKKAEMQKEEYSGRGGQSDALILLSLNTKDKTAFMLNISRDTMTDIDIYDMSGNLLKTEEAQIALQYAYGDGEKRSCWLTKKAVSHLLNDLPIHAYLALNIDGISTINDVLGGVEITVPEDYTFIDPAFVKGETLTLTGNQAERYVRYRDIQETGSNDGRMIRQNQFLKALVQMLRNKASDDDKIIDALYTAGKAYMTTDMTADQMKELTEYQLDDSFLKVPGEIHAGAEHDEYQVNYDALENLLIEKFYIRN